MTNTTQQFTFSGARCINDIHIQSLHITPYVHREEHESAAVVSMLDRKVAMKKARPKSTQTQALCPIILATSMPYAHLFLNASIAPQLTYLNVFTHVA